MAIKRLREEKTTIKEQPRLTEQTRIKRLRDVKPATTEVKKEKPKELITPYAKTVQALKQPVKEAKKPTRLETPKTSITKVKEQAGQLKKMGEASTRSAMAAQAKSEADKPKYRERVMERLEKIPPVLRPLAALPAAISETPFSRAVRQVTMPEKEKGPRVTGPAALAADILLPLTVPGAGLGGGAMYQRAGQVLERFAPKLAQTLVPAAEQTIGKRIASEAIKGAATGGLLAPATQLALDPEASGRELAESAAIGAGGGALLGGAAPLVQKGITRLAGRRKPSVSEPAPVTPTQGLDDSLRERPTTPKPITEDMTPPLENPNELAKWVKEKGGFDDVSLNEMRRIPYEELRQLADEIVTSRSPRPPVSAAQPARAQIKRIAPTEQQVPAQPVTTETTRASSEVQSRINQIDANLKTYKDNINNQVRNGILTYDEAAKQIKGRAMAVSAQKRELIQGDSLVPVEGGLTGKELQTKINRLRTNYAGKEVIVDGQEGVITKMSFGKVGVKFADGQVKFLESDLVKPKVDVDELIRQQSVPKAPPAPVPSVPAVPPARVPTTPVQPVEALPQERGLVTTLRESGRLEEPVQRGLEASQARTYEKITNVATVEAANRRIAQGIDSAESYVMGAGKEMDAERVATGFRLIDELQRAGNFERAVTVAENLAEKLTRAGQTVQAAAIWNLLTPEGALVAANRIVKRVNENLPKWSKDAKVGEKMSSDISSAASAIQASKGSQQRANDVMDIMDRARAGEEISLTERQAIVDFMKDARKFVEPPKTPKPPKIPKEMQDPRIRDRIVTSLDSLEQQAKQRLRDRGMRASSLPLDVWGDYALIGAAKLGKGIVKFSDWSEQMVRDLGEEIRPYLSKIYEQAQETFAINSKRVREETISKAENIAEAYVRKNERTLRPEDINEIRTLARQVSSLAGDARVTASQDLQAYLNSFERAGIGKKIAATQYIAMLLNPKTQVRNIVGNEIMYRLTRLNRMLATPVDWAASKLTGSDRQITWRGGQREWGDFYKDLKIGGRAGWRGIDPAGLATAYDIRGQVFKGKLNPLTYMEKMLGASMKSFDYAAYNRATQQRLGEMGRLDAINKGIRGEENLKLHTQRYIANVDDNIDNLAKEYGKYVTFQNETALSKGLQKVKTGLNLGKDFGIGSLILPFVKTPANLLMRALEYSPAGFIKAIGQTAEILGKRNTDLTRADVITSVTRAILGTGGLGGTALWLADKGVITGDLSQDRDVRELQKQAGLSNFQINASALKRMVGAIGGGMSEIDEAAKVQDGDTFYQYEWAQPTSIPIALGANIMQERKKPGEKGTPLEQGVHVTMGALNTLMNTSVLRGLQQAFDLPPGTKNKVEAFGINIVRQLPSMFTPSIVNQVNQLIDNKVRETYSPDLVEMILNPARSRIPILSQDLPQDVTTLGQPVEREMNAFDVFLSPAQKSKFKPTPEAKMVMDLLMETGEEKIAPRAVPRYIEGTDRVTRESRRVDLTGEQFIRYQTLVGQETLKLLGKVRDTWSTEKKVEYIIKSLTEAGTRGKNEMKKELGLRITR